MNADKLLDERYKKFRGMGRFTREEELEHA